MEERFISKEVIEVIQMRARNNPLFCYDPHDFWEMQKELSDTPNPIQRKLQKEYKINTNNISWWMLYRVYKIVQNISELPEDQKQLELRQLINDINDGRFTTVMHERIDSRRQELIEKFKVPNESLKKIAFYNLEKVLGMFDQTKYQTKSRLELLQDIERGKYEEIYSVLPQPVKRSTIYLEKINGI